MVRFLAELAYRSDHIIYPTPSSAYVKKYNIYEIDIDTPPTDSYWIDWGGDYDEFVGEQIQLFFGVFLQQAQTVNQLLATSNSLFITSNNICLINIPNHPWLYPDYQSESEIVRPFLSDCLIPSNPAYNTVKGMIAQVRLERPNFTIKLSDNISGITLNQDFSLSLDNHDGYFDNEELWNLFNTPVHLKKAVVENPKYEDFRTIRDGLIENTQTSFDRLQIDVADRFRSMGEPVCTVIRQQDYQDIVISEKNLNKNIPIVYGRKRVKILPLDGSHFIAAESVTTLYYIYNKDSNILPATITNGVITFNYAVITGVFNKDNKSVAFTYQNGVLSTVLVRDGDNDDGTPHYEYPHIDYIVLADGTKVPFKYDKDTGIITYDDADTADITGYTANDIGSIILDLVKRKADIPDTDIRWNREEIEAYRASAQKINIEINSSDVKKAIQDVLKSDMAYFIQQNDGRFTIRKYGEMYTSHDIDEWTITKKPEKTWGSAQDNFFSSCIVNYNYVNDDEYSSFLFRDNENEAEDIYRRKTQKTFETDLTTSDAARALAQLLSKRYTYMKQTIKVSLGIDTSSFELLDNVILNININGRKFSNASSFIIKEINPAQDTLTLEEIDTIDITGEFPATIDGDYITDYDNMYANTADSLFTTELDGGGV